jgi:hypothetical protein
MNADMPSITDASHSHSIYGLANLSAPINSVVGTATSLQFAGTGALGGMAGGAASNQMMFGGGGAEAPILNRRMSLQPQPKETPMPPRRLVQVFIADPDENVPLEQSMLYSGDQKLTDATDQELFFEIDMKSVLEKHNAERIKLVNKKVKERTEYLEPAKIRDLKMVVVNVATF